MRAIFDQIIPRHGGTVVQVMGDGVLASFGYPNAMEDDGRRATEAALDLHDAVRNLDLGVPLPIPLTMHSGIHEGLVLLEKGDSVTGTLKLVGNAVNVAARLSSVAQSDEIVVSTETLGSDKHFFDTDEERTHDLKGVDGPVVAYRVLGRAAVETRFDARERDGLTPFITRQAEYDAMQAVLDETLAGATAFLTIVAPPGLGKTRLAREFLNNAVPTNARVLRGYCESYLGSEPLQPFLQMLRALTGIDDAMSNTEAGDAVRETLVALDPELGGSVDIFLNALSLAEADAETGKTIVRPAQRLFECLAKASPLVLFVDDWQWVDDVSRDIFDGLHRLDVPIMVLSTSREMPERQIGRSQMQTISLQPFSDVDLDQTISHLLPGINVFLAQQIRDFAGGNPLFLEELCRASTDVQTQSLTQSTTGEAWLGALIVARVDKLPNAVAEIVRTAAIIGNVVPIWLLEGLTGSGLSEELAQTLAQNDLLHPDEQPGRLRFKHGIAREVIYESVGLHQRRKQHLSIAEMLRESTQDGAQDGILEALAYHHLAGRDFPNAATYAELAGDKAVATLALDRGRKQYVAALEAIDQLSTDPEQYARWVGVMRRLSPLCVFDPHPDQLPRLRRAVELAQENADEAGQGYAYYWLGYVHYAMGDATEATRHLEAAMQRAEQLDDLRLRRFCEATLGQAYAASSAYDKATDLLEKTVGVAANQLGKRTIAVGAAYSEAIRGSILGDQGHFAEADECFARAGAIIAENPEGFIAGSIMLWKGAVAAFQGRWELARSETLNALRMADRTKSTLHLGRGTTQLGYIDWTSNGNAEALLTIEDGTSWLEANNIRLFISLDHGWLAEGLIAQREIKRARHFAAMALRRARAGDRLGEAMACRAMARAASAGSGTKSWEHYLAKADLSATSRKSKREHALNDMCRGEILLANGQRQQALDQLGPVMEQFQAMDMAWHAEAAQRLTA
jgi:tetratricopeptide (TPR) repeat protein